MWTKGQDLGGVGGEKQCQTSVGRGCHVGDIGPPPAATDSPRLRRSLPVPVDRRDNQNNRGGYDLTTEGHVGADLLLCEPTSSPLRPPSYHGRGGGH